MSTFMDHIHRQSENEEPRDFWYVNVYEDGMQYGGPEEGGWHYPTGAFDLGKSGVLVDVTETEAHQAARDLKSDLDEQATEDETPPVSSVRYQGGRYVVRAERHEGRDFPAERPHYE